MILEGEEILELLMAANRACQTVWDDYLLGNDGPVNLADSGPSEECHVLSGRFFGAQDGATDWALVGHHCEAEHIHFVMLFGGHLVAM